MYNSWNRKLSKNFEFGTRGEGLAGSIALANRIPARTKYYLYVQDGVSGILCGSYNAEGAATCKSLSNGNQEGGKYVIR